MPSPVLTLADTMSAACSPGSSYSSANPAYIAPRDVAHRRLELGLGLLQVVIHDLELHLVAGGLHGLAVLV